MSFTKGINLGGIPTVSNDGDIWYDSSTNKLMVRIAGVNREISVI